jgi:hypothetical protein
MIYITGDTHGDFSSVERFCYHNETTRGAPKIFPHMMRLSVLVVQYILSRISRIYFSQKTGKYMSLTGIVVLQSAALTA